MSLKAFFIIATMSLLTACVSTQGPSSLNGNTALTAQGCQAKQVKLIGQVANESTLKRAQAQAGADRIRLMLPDRMYTTDYDEARLSIRVDANNHIQSIYCG